MSILKRLFSPKEKKIWKETKRENLGNYMDMGSHPMDITTMYRIAIFETEVSTGETRVRQITDILPA